MKVLVLCSGYPTRGNPYNCMWAHTRNRYYVRHGIDVDVVVTDSPSEEYSVDGVSVVSVDSAIARAAAGDYTTYISHSPNIRRHLPLLSRLPPMRTILFMHGTESMRINHDYPRPYAFMRPSLPQRIRRDAYDWLKFKILRRFIARRRELSLVFVSQWMADMFRRNVMDPENSGVDFHVINNSLGTKFLVDSHRLKPSPLADFVTLRRLDYSKFAIDLVVAAAEANGDKTFHVYGKGEYFNHFRKPDNLTLIERHLDPDEIPFVLNGYRCALMPTRCDAQGVMVCEMAVYGMTVITSDISVSREMFSGFGNVKLLSETEFHDRIELDAMNFDFDYAWNKQRFSFQKTLERELALIAGRALL